MSVRPPYPGSVFLKDRSTIRLPCPPLITVFASSPEAVCLSLSIPPSPGVIF